MVDWSIARQITRFAAGGGPAADLGVDLPALVDGARGHVVAYTGLDPGSDVPAAEQVDRREWAEANLATLAGLLDPVAGRLEHRFDRAGPLAGALRAAAGATLAAECGLVVAYMSQKVLGQYEVSLLQPDTPARLLFVAPNLERAVSDLDADRESFLGWIALHETTHVVQFAGVPWLRGHLGTLLRTYLESVEVRIDRGAAGGLPALPDIGRIVESFREGGLAALVQTGEQRGLLARIQATMAVVEGYSEHVMDAVGEGVLPAYAGLRDAMERRRRTRSAPDRILMRLLGFDLKMRQYELGKRFCDAVVELGGIELLNVVWRSPQDLPSASELERPRAWAARVEREPAAGAA